jgi:hypothetical protein
MSAEFEELDENTKQIGLLKKQIKHFESYIQNLESSLEKKKNQEKLYYQFFNTMPFPILLIDIDTFVIFDCNEEFVDRYQIAKDDLFLKYSPSDFLPDLSMYNLTIKHKSYQIPYVHRINNKHYFVELKINPFISDLSNYLIITININKIQE